MKLLIPTSQYKKDLKRYAKQRKKLEALLEILRCLANEGTHTGQLPSTHADWPIQRLHGMPYWRRFPLDLD